MDPSPECDAPLGQDVAANAQGKLFSWRIGVDAAGDASNRTQPSALHAKLEGIAGEPHLEAWPASLELARDDATGSEHAPLPQVGLVASQPRRSRAKQTH